MVADLVIAVWDIVEIFSEISGCLFSEKSICEAEDFEKVSICSPGNISGGIKMIFICFVSKGIFTQHSSYAFWLSFTQQQKV